MSSLATVLLLLLGAGLIGSGVVAIARRQTSASTEGADLRSFVGTSAVLLGGLWIVLGPLSSTSKTAVANVDDARLGNKAPRLPTESARWLAGGSPGRPVRLFRPVGRSPEIRWLRDAAQDLQGIDRSAAL